VPSSEMKLLRVSLWFPPLWISLSHASTLFPVTSLSPGATETEEQDLYLITTIHDRDHLGFRSHLQSLQEDLPVEDLQILKVYDNLLGFSVPHLPHYAARLTPRGLSLLEQRADIVYMERDQVMSINDCNTQQSPDWGLSRVNQRGAFKLGTFASDTRFDGGGINIYIIGRVPPPPPIAPSSHLPLTRLDTGIYCENDDFVNKVEGSCTYGIDVIGESIRLKFLSPPPPSSFSRRVEYR
jgi:hypothetical protein